MRIPVAWLREYIDVPENTAEMQRFADDLTMAGLEVEETLSTVDGPTFYAKITPNRGDWASVYGAAREAAAARSATLKPLPSPVTISHSDASGAFASVTIEDGENCPRYAAMVIRGVKIGPAPPWMQNRLTAALGDKYRPVNNVVDTTNYVMLELGQPLHAFDLATLPEGKIVVRQAQNGEAITTLDGTERNLTPGILCICDKNKPIAIAGIMGGGPTEISDSTVDVLLESAHFDPFSIRRTSKRLGLMTEASYRFERYVDPALVPIAAERAAQLITQVAGGEIVPGLIDVYPGKKPPRRVLARVERIRKLLGADVDRDIMIAGLERLGISVERSAGALDCVIPTWRPDLTIEDDIAEEVGRIALGYENLPETVPPLLNPRGGDSPRGLFLRTVRNTLVGEGFQEVLSHSLVAPSPLVTTDEAAQRVMVRSALSPELSSLRASLLPSLLSVVARGHANGLRDMAVFEAGPVYRKAQYGYAEPLRISGVLSGSVLPPAWSVKADVYPVDYYTAKGAVENLLATLGLGSAAFTTSTHPITHPGRTAQISVGGEPLGIVAELSEQTVEENDLPRRTYLFDLDGDLLMRLAAESVAHFTPLSRFPSVTRDVAPVFDTAVPYADIEQAARQAAGPLLESLRLTDVYRGANLGDNRRSLTLRFTFRSYQETLKEAEIEAALTSVRQALTGLGGELRNV